MTTKLDAQLRSLRKLNIAAGFLHLASLVAVLLLSNTASLPVIASYEIEPGKAYADPVLLFNSRIAIVVALFLGLSATFHFIVASKWFFKRYTASLQKHINVFRWVEYSLSSSLMIYLIAQLNGIRELAALAAIVGVNISMILFGWLQEKYNEPGDGQWLPFTFGSIAGIVPWLIVLFYIIGPKAPSAVQVPGFVYGIVISLFLLFNCFALVQYKQYKAKGKWANYLRGEKAYIILSFTAKSALAWQLFAAVLGSSS
ncbi:heliorhodopsin HeR [Aeromicrobium sp.]|nr:heliorhodopsin HeR [Candidatus Saccharibacteria bacterium]